MANITGLITVNHKQIYEVDADPSAGGGTPAAIASLAMYDSGTVGYLYLKTGSSDTAWSLVDTNASDWSLSGNALTGGSESTPNEFFGSTNDYDVIHRRNNVEVMRMIGDTADLNALLIGLNASIGGRLQLSVNNYGDYILSQQTVATSGANIVRVSKQYKVQTTDAVATTLMDIAIPTDSVFAAEVTVVARQHGGASGTVGDGAVYVREFHARNDAGTVTLQKRQNSFTSEDVNSFNLVESVSSTNIRYEATGASGRNIAWSAHVEFMVAVD